MDIYISLFYGQSVISGVSVDVWLILTSGELSGCDAWFRPGRWASSHSMATDTCKLFSLSSAEETRHYSSRSRGWSWRKLPSPCAFWPLAHQMKPDPNPCACLLQGVWPDWKWPPPLLEKGWGFCCHSKCPCVHCCLLRGPHHHSHFQKLKRQHFLLMLHSLNTAVA